MIMSKLKNTKRAKVGKLNAWDLTLVIEWKG